MALFRKSSHTLSLRWIRAQLRRRSFVALLVVAGGYAVHADAQISEGTGYLSSTMVFGTFGGENTNLPAYSDNALGFDLGASFQPHPLVGLEFRGGAYPFSARYVQMEFTGGYRIEKQTAFGFAYAPFAYIGGGWARSQDKGLGNTQYPPMWDPCWQADMGFDRTYHSFSWRVAQISWRETYTQLHSLRSIGLSTGIVYRFQHE